MVKITNKFICQNCGYESYKWLGRCPGCDTWNSMVEERAERKPVLPAAGNRAVVLKDIPDQDIYRFNTGLGELDRVLGGGVVPGSLILLGGDPGIGKSTLLLQVAAFLTSTGERVLYLSGEESLRQIRLRSMRLGIESNSLYLLNEQNIDLIEQYIKEIDPVLVIVDSIQTVYSSEISSIPGSIVQLRECTARLTAIAKKREKAFFLIGHVTKEGNIAGPKVLEHMVDVVVSFEGDKNFAFRILRASKNRFGATDEIGLLEMSSQGLVEVEDPSGVFLSSHKDDASGTAITASFEGSRPFLIEVQSLVTPAGPGYARRMASGIDQNRMALIIAVLEKRTPYNLTQSDVYLKVTGGVFLKDPSVDLGIAAAIISSYIDQPLPGDTVYVGEIGLTGQIRPVPLMDLRLREVEKMGYQRMVVPDQRNNSEHTGLKIIPMKSIDDFVKYIMEG